MKPQPTLKKKEESKSVYSPRPKHLMDHLISPETRHKLHCLKNHLHQIELQAKKNIAKAKAVSSTELQGKYSTARVVTK